MDAAEIASLWLADFAKGIYTGNIEKFVSAFRSDGWLRDLLVFSWGTRSLEGPSKIRQYLGGTLTTPGISNVKLQVQPHLNPYAGPITPIHSGIGAGFTFETNNAVGKGYFRLMKSVDTEEWRALTVYMALDDLKGFEENGPELGLYEGRTLPWESVRQSRREYAESNPYVLIVGGAQTGLITAARLKQMNIPAIVVERSLRIGDVWRNRYPTLTLHTTQRHHEMLYQSYPRNWPKYTPRDKVADWLEQYAITQDLVVWTDSEPLPYPKYDTDTRKWTVRVKRSGNEIILHPSHIVIAAGTLGALYIPSFPGLDDFVGSKVHTGSFRGAKEYRGKRVAVVGAGNTAADVCQDLVTHEAQSVTMIERSSTCVVSLKSMAAFFDATWRPDVPTEVADFKQSSIPYGLAHKVGIASQETTEEEHKEMYDGLRKAGLKLNMGIEGAGLYSLFLGRHGGYWIDVGCAQQIIAGKIKIKQGVEIDHFTKGSITFTDGSSLEADVVVFATGYHDVRDSMRTLFGDEVIEKTSPVWGLDEEGEIRGMYQPSGYPGLWFATGDFYYSRYYSKRMALQMKAMELGLYTP